MIDVDANPPVFSLFRDEGTEPSRQYIPVPDRGSIAH